MRGVNNCSEGGKRIEGGFDFLYEGWAKDGARGGFIISSVREVDPKRF